MHQTTIAQRSATNSKGDHLVWSVTYVDGKEKPYLLVKPGTCVRHYKNLEAALKAGGFTA
jgi:hypothetical protein